MLHRGLLNKKFLGPFGPVRPAGLDFQARPGPRAARPVAISNIDIQSKIKFLELLISKIPVQKYQFQYKALNTINTSSKQRMFYQAHYSCGLRIKPLFQMKNVKLNWQRIEFMNMAN